MTAVTGYIRRHLDGRRFAAFGFQREGGTRYVVQLGLVFLDGHIINAFFARTAEVLAPVATGTVQAHANLVALVDDALEHELVRLAQVRIARRIDHERRSRTATTAHHHHATGTHLHDATERNTAVFAEADRGLAGKVVHIGAGTAAGTATGHAATPVAHATVVSTTGIRLGTAVGTHHVHRIRRLDVVREILARKEHHQVRLRRNRRIAKNPASRHVGIVRKANAFQVYRGIARIVQFNPSRVVTVVILEGRIGRGHFRKDDREPFHTLERFIDDDLVGIFARERAVVAALVLVALVAVVHAGTGRRERTRTADDNRRTRIKEDVALVQFPGMDGNGIPVTHDQDRIRQLVDTRNTGITNNFRFRSVVSRIIRAGHHKACHQNQTKTRDVNIS